jgi:hypothetical protein
MEDRFSDSIAVLIPKFGDESWEIVDCGSSDEGHIVYFKRPKQE